MIAIAALPADALGAKLRNRPPPPKLPLAQWWSVDLEGPVSAGPVAAGSRIYLAYTSGTLIARDAADGHELWRQKKDVALPMAADGDLLFVASGDAIDAINGATGRSAWMVPRVKSVAPLVAQDGWLIATTDTELIAIRTDSGTVAWRHPAGGVTLAPVIDGDRLYTGAEDGRVLALSLRDGAEAWQTFISGGATAIAAYKGRVYVGGGDKQLHCLQSAKQGKSEWQYALGAQALGHIAVDDDRVYVAALNNVVRAHDRESGNQRWQRGVGHRPLDGAFASGHVIFVPGAETNEVQLLWDKTGEPSGALNLPGDTPPGLRPAILDSADGGIVYAVTGGLTNEWSLTKFAPAGEAALIPLAKLDPMPGVPYLTDPELQPIGNVLGLMILADPLLQPLSEAAWPIILTDPPLVPLTTLPGLQLRPLSPVPPVRRGGPPPAG